MRKILLRDAHPELAAQVSDQSILDTLGSGGGRSVRWRCEKGHEWTAPVINRVKRGDGCPYCSGRFAIPRETDLATTHPKIAAQLVDQSLVTKLKATSHKRVEWRCSRGHVWDTPVANRVQKGSGCPYCSGRKAWPGETDLATLYPELAAQLVDRSLATKLRPGSNVKVEWRCDVCGQTWSASPNTRVNMGSGCPFCAGQRLIPGVNDLATRYPEIAAQLVDKSLARELFATSNRVVEWHCDKGHIWSALLPNRTNLGEGCPICAAASHSSAGERDFGAFVAEIVGADNVLLNDRSAIAPQEIDVLIPSLGLGIEYNGVYWHSAGVRGSSDHKRELCNQAGIDLMVVWEDDWRDRQDAVKSRVRSWISTVSLDQHDGELLEIPQRMADKFKSVQTLCRTDFKRYVGVFEDGRIVGLFGFDVCEFGDFVQFLGGECDFRSYLHRLFAEFGNTSKKLFVTDNEHDLTRWLCEDGCEVIGQIEPDRFITGQPHRWRRVSCQSSAATIADGEHVVYNSGRTVWNIGNMC